MWLLRDDAPLTNGTIVFGDRKEPVRVFPLDTGCWIVRSSRIALEAKKRQAQRTIERIDEELESLDQKERS
jgi:hypothetical protein